MFLVTLFIKWKQLYSIVFPLSTIFFVSASISTNLTGRPISPGASRSTGAWITQTTTSKHPHLSKGKPYKMPPPRYLLVDSSIIYYNYDRNKIITKNMGNKFLRRLGNGIIFIGAALYKTKLKQNAIYKHKFLL